MALRLSSPPLRILVIADKILFLILLLSLQLTDGNSDNNLLNGHLNIPIVQEDEEVLAVRNQPFILQCPLSAHLHYYDEEEDQIVSEEEEEELFKIVDFWWIKNGERLKAEFISDSKEDFEQTSSHSNSHSHTPSSRRVRIIRHNGDLEFETIIHKVTTSNFNLDIDSENINNNQHDLETRNNFTDEGVYRCAFKFSNGVIFSSAVTLSVAVIESVQEESANVFANKGDSALLNCQIRSVPRAQTQIVWQIGDKRLSEQHQDVNSRYNVISSSGSSPGNLLHIKNVQLKDSGSYRCLVKNEVLNRELRSEINLIVHDESSPTTREPEFLPTFKDNSLLVLGENESTSLHCIANGYPTPELAWIFTTYESLNGSIRSPMKNVLSDGEIGSSTYKLDPEKSILNGNYTCVARGLNSTVSKTIILARLTTEKQRENI